jgi:hypothetical protein
VYYRSDHYSVHSQDSAQALLCLMAFGCYNLSMYDCSGTHSDQRSRQIAVISALYTSATSLLSGTQQIEIDAPAVPKVHSYFKLLILMPTADPT